MPHFQKKARDSICKCPLKTETQSSVVGISLERCTVLTIVPRYSCAPGLNRQKEEHPEKGSRHKVHVHSCRSSAPRSQSCRAAAPRGPCRALPSALLRSGLSPCDPAQPRDAPPPAATPTAPALPAPPASAAQSSVRPGRPWRWWAEERVTPRAAFGLKPALLEMGAGRCESHSQQLSSSMNFRLRGHYDDAWALALSFSIGASLFFQLKRRRQK